jgi:hypothetical protein
VTFEGQGKAWIARASVVAAVCALWLVVSASPAPSRAEEPPAKETAVLDQSPVELGEEPILSAGPLEYRPGRGLRLGPTGVVIGGFTNIKGEDSQESGGEFSIDTLNFFLIFDRFTRFRAVAELQLDDLFVADDDHAGTRDFAFDVRRLFGEFTISDEVVLRAGTFLTPVGYWNLILAPPLTWTTEPPVIVEETFFQPTTTGAMLHGSAGVSSGRLGYSLFTQFLEPLENNPDLNPPDHTGGIRLTYDTDRNLSVGATYQASEDDGDWNHLSGLHALWQPARWEILGEVYLQEGLDSEPGETSGSSQWGTFVQAAFEIYRPFYLVGRYEHYEPPSPESALNLVTLGGVWRPLPFMALKAEYRFADDELEDEDPAGFFCSFTTFF